MSTISQTTQKGIKELILSATLYEVLGTVCEAIIMVIITHKSITESLELGIILSLIALIWNTIFNHFFDIYLLKKHGNIIKSKIDRIIHGFSFEAVFAILSLATIMFYFKISLKEAFSLEAAILVFFLFYTVAFTYVYDLVRAKILSSRRHINI